MIKPKLYPKIAPKIYAFRNVYMGEDFVGPLDGFPVPPTAVSFRRLLSSWTGALCRWRRSIDDAEQDFGYTSVIDANGDQWLDIAEVANFIGAGTGFIVKKYDQTGNGNDLAQATAANQPVYSETAINGLPGGVYSAASLPSSLGTFSQPVTLAAVAERTGSFTSNMNVFGGDNAGVARCLIGFSSTADNARIAERFSSGNVAAADNVAHVLIGVFQGASSVFNVDGTETPISLGTDVLGPLTLGGGLPSNASLVGRAGEAIFWDSVLSPANRAILAANQKAAWGTP